MSDPATALELIERYQVSWTTAAPTFVTDLCAAVTVDSPSMTSPTRISSTGAPIPPALADQVRNRLGARLLAVWASPPGVRVEARTPRHEK
ncbi:AMP-binding protein [Nocardia spumae]